MVRTHCLMLFFSASVLSLSPSFSSSDMNTTKLPILAFLFLAVSASIFLTKLVKESLTSRAKIIATGLLPLRQTWQFFSPAAGPFRFSTSKGPGMFVPTCGPDLRPSPATAPATASTATAKVPIANRLMVEFLLVRKRDGLHGDDNYSAREWN